MIKYVLIVFIMITSFLSAEIKDEINFLKAKDIELLNKRIESLESDYDINFKIYIDSKDIDVETELNELKKSVIISIIKTNEEKVKVLLNFSKDMNILQYKEEVEDLLDRIEYLVVNEYFLDLVYELTGDISDILNLVKLETEDEKLKRNSLNKRNKILKNIFITFFIVVFVYIVSNLFTKIYGKKIRKCKFCDIDMDLTDKKIQNSKVIKSYTCRICGYSKQITSFRR